MEMDLDTTLIHMNKEELHFLLSNILSNMAKHSIEQSQGTITLKGEKLTFYNCPKKERALLSILQGESSYHESYGLDLIRNIAADYRMILHYEVLEDLLSLSLDVSSITINDRNS